MPADITVAAVARQLGIEVTDYSDRSPMASSSHGVIARAETGTGSLFGFGAAATAQRAHAIAIMECAQRWAQFTHHQPPAITESYSALGSAAVCPVDFGLYADWQYRSAGFGLMPFDDRVPLDWVEAIDLVSGETRLVPLELIHPHAVFTRRRLAYETSSGTAIHVDAELATTAAVCETIERDAILVFWHRRPATPVEPLSTAPPGVRADLEQLSRNGAVATVCRLDYDIGVPTYLVFALQGSSFACGSATHPDACLALEHAVRELGANLRPSTGAGRYMYLPVAQVREAAHHRALYDGGPLAAVLRAALETCLFRSDSTPSAGPSAIVSNSGIVARLAAAGFSTLARDITPPQLQDCGVVVIRVLVAGLIPFYVGYNHIRLGCARLTGDLAPGRLTTLLPHFKS